MKTATFFALLVLVGCNRMSPSAPSPTPPPVLITAPVVTPPVTPPPVVMPPPSLPVSDPRFDLGFYRQFAHNGLENPALVSLRRQTQAPRIYLRTIDNAGAPIDAFTLNETAAALENTAGKLTGVFGLAGLERGTDTREGQRGWITVRWSDRAEMIDRNTSLCGWAQIAGGLIILYPKSPWCRCPGGPAVTLSTVKHELGHALGFWHTDSRDDLMHRIYNACDADPSPREIFHAAVAYSMPLGSVAP